MNNAKLVSEAAKEGKFSETLVKQLLRTGEDRKTTVEETRLLDIKIKEVKNSQRRQKDQLVKVIRGMERVVDDMNRTKDYVEKIRYGQERVHSQHSACKSGGREYVTTDVFKKTKERINFAFDQYSKLFSECMRRDHVLAESLL